MEECEHVWRLEYVGRAREEKTYGNLVIVKVEARYKCVKCNMMGTFVFYEAIKVPEKL